MSIKISVDKNATYTLLTAEKYCLDDIEVKVAVPTPTYTRHASLMSALSGTSVSSTGKVGGYTDENDMRHIVLLEDLEVTTSATFSTPCVLHLNGHKLFFSNSGTHLVAKADMTIDGTVYKSEITKHGVASTASEKLVIANGAHLTMIGGKYSITDIDAGFAIPVSADNVDNTILTMKGCVVECNGSGNTIAKGAQVYRTVYINDCEFNVTSENGSCYGIHGLTGKTTVQDTTVNVHASGKPSTISGIESYNGGTMNISDCIVDADGYGDVLKEDGKYDSCGVSAISAVFGSTVSINGGTYWGAREALMLNGTVDIYGGTFKGCQHGGAYFATTSGKARNATFVNVVYNDKNGCNWDDTTNGRRAPHYAAVYCGSSSRTVNAEFDNCIFKAEIGTGTDYGIVSKKGDNSNYATTASISNSVFGENLDYDLRVESGCKIEIGENVVYRQDAVMNNGGTIEITGKKYPL